MTLEEELRLVEEAKSNVQAFDKLYEYYFDKILYYCANRLSSIELAEDVTCQVFLSALVKIKSFNTSKNIRFGSWLYTNAHNKIVDWYRSNSRRILLELDDSAEAPKVDLEYELSVRFEHNKLLLALSKLNKRYQQVISLRFFSELEMNEIAEVMKIKQDNAAVLLHRAINALKKKYKQIFKE